MAVGGTRVDIKVVLLGKENVGKTALFERFLHDHFIGAFSYQSTIGASYGGKRMVSDTGEALVLGIWDTAGSERYESMSRLYYRDAKAAVVCYDMLEASSFLRAKYWVQELTRAEPTCRVYLAACKADLVVQDPSLRKVDTHDVADYSDSIHAQHFETSALTGDNIAAIFQSITNDMVRDRNLRRQNDEHAASIQVHGTASQRKGCC